VAGLRSIGATISEVVRDGKATNEVRDYISSLPVEPGAGAFAHAVRSHWGVENGCHWTLDVTFREDESRIREEHLRQNMAWLNRFSLSLLKQYPDRKSVAARRRCCGWSDDYLMQVLLGSAC
jgi:predicted transposase YbfD/YdcC